MPEIAESTTNCLIFAAFAYFTNFVVARIVHFLRIHLVGKTIASASAIDDNNVFGKVGTTGAAVETALKGRKVGQTVP